MFAQQKLQETTREIVYRTSGYRQGPITRLMSPSDLGQLVKPFVFLDWFEFDDQAPPMDIHHGWHPHSGIATVTVVLDGAIRFAETTGREGVLPAGGVEWMRAGNGVWHTGAPEPQGVRGFQLWVALPPALENGPNASQYLLADEVAKVGPARVVLGSYQGATSAIDAPPMTYLAVRLDAGERWTYQPPRGHDVAWVAVAEGTLRTATDAVHRGEMAVFADSASEQPIDFVAQARTEFVIGSATKHPHRLALGSYSVHTSNEALRRGETEIRRIGAQLRADGVLRR